MHLVHICCDPQKLRDWLMNSRQEAQALHVLLQTLVALLVATFLLELLAIFFVVIAFL